MCIDVIYYFIYAIVVVVVPVCSVIAVSGNMLITFK